MSDRPDPIDPADRPEDVEDRDPLDRAPGEDADRPTRSPGEPGTADEVHGASEVHEPTPITQQIGRIAIVVLAVLFGIFAVANSQPVDFSWVVGETQVRRDPEGPGEIGGVPLIVLLLITFVIGALLGALIQWYTGRSRRAKRDQRR